MVASLGTLISASWNSFTKAFVTIVIGAVIFGLIMGFGQSFVGQRALKETTSVFEGLGVNLEEMEDLQERLALGDEGAAEELAMAMEELGGDMQEEAIAGVVVSMFKKMLPMIGVSVLIAIAISLIANAYFLIVALNDKATFQQALAGAPKLIIPLFLLWLWLLIRSFVWIPFIGIITGIIFLPRFILSPVLLVRDKKGVLESAKISYAKTQGFWGKIIGNIIVVGIIAIVAQIILGIVIGMFGMRISTILSPVVQMLVTAFLTIFTVKIALAIEHSSQKA